MAGTAEGAALTVLRGEPGPAPFSAWHLDAANVLIGVAGVDAPRDVRAGQGMIQAGQPVDPRSLADPALSLQRLAKPNAPKVVASVVD